MIGGASVVAADDEAFGQPDRSVGLTQRLRRHPGRSHRRRTSVRDTSVDRSHFEFSPHPAVLNRDIAQLRDIALGQKKYRQSKALGIHSREGRGLVSCIQPLRNGYNGPLLRN